MVVVVWSDSKGNYSQVCDLSQVKLFTKELIFDFGVSKSCIQCFELGNEINFS